MAPELDCNIGIGWRKRIRKERIPDPENGMTVFNTSAPKGASRTKIPGEPGWSEPVHPEGFRTRGGEHSDQRARTTGLPAPAVPGTSPRRPRSHGQTCTGGGVATARGTIASPQGRNRRLWPRSRTRRGKTPIQRENARIPATIRACVVDGAPGRAHRAPRSSPRGRGGGRRSRRPPRGGSHGGGTGHPTVKGEPRVEPCRGRAAPPLGLGSSQGHPSLIHILLY